MLSTVFVSSINMFAQNRVLITHNGVCGIDIHLYVCVCIFMCVTDQNMRILGRDGWTEVVREEVSY